MINGFKKIDVEMSRMFRFWSPVDGMCFRKSCGTNNGLRLSQDIKRRARWKNPYYFRCRGRKGNVALGVAYAEGDVNVCVMVSGGGSNLKALHHASIQNKLGGGKIKAVVSDKPNCGGWKFAEQNGIITVPFIGDGNGNTGKLAKTLHDDLDIDVILLAGFLKLVPLSLCEMYERAMLNIHPALLPSFGGKGFYGERVHKAVIASGVRVTGPTVHFVSAEYDRGPILSQRAVPVFPADTPEILAARVLKAEHDLYPEAASALCGGKVLWRDDGVPFYNE